MITVSGLYIYPIKSLGGIALSSAEVTDRGFKHDRRWMLVDENNRFLSQREFAEMALLKVEIEANGLKVSHKKKPDTLLIPFIPEKNEPCDVAVWDDTCPALYVSDDADAWFSKMLGFTCRLVYMPDDSHRRVEEKYAFNDEITSFSDAYPFLLISQASLDDLNTRLAESLPMNRFRPNIVIEGTDPYYEDIMQTFTINGIIFKGAKLCARCNITTIDQESIQKGKEPIKTLARYRTKNSKILFGQNLLHIGIGRISVSDEVTGISLHTDERFIVNS